MYDKNYLFIYLNRLIYSIFLFKKSSSLTVFGFNLFFSKLIWLPTLLKSLSNNIEVAGISKYLYAILNKIRNFFLLSNHH